MFARWRQQHRRPCLIGDVRLKRFAHRIFVETKHRVPQSLRTYGIQQHVVCIIWFSGYPLQIQNLAARKGTWMYAICDSLDLPSFVFQLLLLWRQLTSAYQFLVTEDLSFGSRSRSQHEFSSSVRQYGSPQSPSKLDLIYKQGKPMTMRPSLSATSTTPWHVCKADQPMSQDI